LTPDGVKRESEIDRSESITPQTGHKLDRSIIIVLAVALAWFAWDRFGSSPEVSVPVEETSTVKVETATEQIAPAKSIAVLPFVAMSSGPDDEYFADGLTEEILNSLAQLPELLVTARTSAFHFKGQDIQVQEIAQALGVDHIVEGSVRKSGQRLRVTAQLIRAEDGFHLWSENYDSTSGDAIAVQEDIAEKIANAMDVVLDEEKRKAMRQAGLRDVEAFITYQKGREIYAKAHGEGDQIKDLQLANQYFEAALERTPEFVPAYVSHSDLYVHILLNDATNQPQASVTVEMVSGAFQNAVDDLAASEQYARTVSERHNASFDLAFLTGNWRGMKGRVEQILNDQGCAKTSWFPPFAAVFGYAEQSLPRRRILRACDPLFSIAWFNETRLLIWAGDAPGALALARQGDGVAPGNWLNQAMIRALVANGDFDEAEAIVANRIQVGEEALVFGLMVAAARGDKQRVAELMPGVQQIVDENGFWDLLIHAWIGDRQRANQMAAEVDQHPAGALALTLLATWCACGAPWDMSATPNFAATVEESGLPWPPVSPIKFPLKDW